MRIPPVLLWGRSPSAIVPQGVSWWICVGILVLLEPSAPPVPVSPWRRAPLGCLVPGCLGPLKTLAVSWRRAPQGCLVPAVVRSWRRAVPSECLLPGRQGPSKAVRLWHRASGLPVLERRVPLKALVAPWGRAPLVPLPPRTAGLLGAAPPRALEGAGVTVVAVTTGLSGAGPPGGVAGGGGGIIA